VLLPPLTAPIPSGWNVLACRAGVTPAETQRLFTAHGNLIIANVAGGGGAGFFRVAALGGLGGGGSGLDGAMGFRGVVELPLDFEVHPHFGAGAEGQAEFFGGVGGDGLFFR